MTPSPPDPKSTPSGSMMRPAGLPTPDAPPAHPSAHAPTPSTILARPALLPGRVLVVDDNARNVFICQKLLREYTLASAGSGEEALAMVPEFRPDVILLDIMMPGMDGYETCRRLRELGTRGGQAKIIMVSAKAMVSERLQGYDAGADDYVSKPFNPDELIAKVRVYLRLKSVEEVDQLRSSLITLMHHETRTPMSYLRAAVEMLSGEGSLSEHQRDLVHMVDEASRRLFVMLERVMLLSTLRAHAYELNVTPLRIGDLMNSALNSLREEAAKRDVDLVLETSDAVVADIDLRFPTLVLCELADNAVRHSGPGSRVVVRVSRDGDQAVVEVRDDGRGIDPDTLARLGEPFTVPDIRHHSRGSGLGLALASELVTAHGGHMDVESRRGAGTIVTIRWPAATASGSSERAA